MGAGHQILQALRDEELGAVEALEEDSRPPLKVIRDHKTGMALCVEYGTQIVLGNIEQQTRLPDQLLCRKTRVTFLHGSG